MTIFNVFIVFMSSCLHSILIFAVIYFRYAHNYIFALTETLKALKEQDELAECSPEPSKHMEAYHPTTNNTYPSIPHFAPSAQAQPDLRYNVNTEHVWGQTAGTTCFQYTQSPQQSIGSQDSYDYYSEVSNSPLSSCSTNEWNPGYSPKHEDSPMKYQYPSYNDHMNHIRPMYNMGATLSHCH